MKSQNRAQIIALIISFLLIMGSGAILLAGTVSAQEDGTTTTQTPTTTPTSTPEGSDNGTATPDTTTTETAADASSSGDNGGSDGGADGESDEQGTDTADSGEQSYEYIFPGDNLRIVDSHWDGKTVVIEFAAANRPERVTLTDAGREAEDNENLVLNRQSYTISTQGTTEVRFTVAEDRQVTIDDGTTLILKGYSGGDLTAPDVHTIVSAALGLLTAFLLVYEFARRVGKLSKRRVVEA